MTIGNRIRFLRRQRNMSLEDIARACGFTKSLLSKIETGVTVPPLATAAQIAKALGVPLSVLLEDGSATKAAVLTRSGSVDETRTDKGYRFVALAADHPLKAMQPILFTAERGKIRKGKPLRHDGEEFVFVLSGSMRYRVGGDEYLLKPGDSLYFDSSAEHDLEPLTQEVHYLAVFVNPREFAAASALKPTPPTKRKRK